MRRVHSGGGRLETNWAVTKTVGGRLGNGRRRLGQDGPWVQTGGVVHPPLPA